MVKIRKNKPQACAPGTNCGIRKSGGNNFLFIFVVMFTALVIRSVLDSTRSEFADAERLSFSAIIEASNSGQIKTLSLNGLNARGELIDGTLYTAKITVSPEMLEQFAKNGAAITIDDSKGWMDYLAMWVPILMGIVFIWWIVRGFRMMSGGGAGGGIASMIGGKTRIVSGRQATRFTDVVGIDNVKREVTEIVDFLRHPKKYRDLGARVPRGILMSGEPGTGKTLLAKAIAGEADVPFYAVSGSDFSGIIVGLGVQKIKDFFELARANAPCILFIDEIDAIGAKRGRSIHSDADREATLNQLLIEMDGFGTADNVIIIAATNRVDMLDAALMRPGRFDRQVYIDLPDMAGRKEILELYAKKMKLDKDISLEVAARGTTGFSGADLNNLLNEAALLAARDNRKSISNHDIDEARDKIMMGPKKDKKMRPEDIKLTAYHEAGHAFVSIHHRAITDPIHKATILPRGRALGMVQYLPTDDKVSVTREEILAELEIYLAGRAAEEVFFGANKITTGAESDIARATHVARASITRWGLSEKIGAIAVNQVDGWGRGALENASQKTAETVDKEVRAWVDSAYKKSKAVLAKNKPKVKKLADELLKRETMTREEIESLLGVKSKAAAEKRIFGKSKNQIRKFES